MPLTFLTLAVSSSPPPLFNPAFIDQFLHVLENDAAAYDPRGVNDVVAEGVQLICKGQAGLFALLLHKTDALNRLFLVVTLLFESVDHKVEAGVIDLEVLLL